MRAQSGREVVHETNVGGVVEALAFGQNAGLGQQPLDLLVALLGQVGLLGLLIDRVVAGREELHARRFGVGLDLDQVIALFVCAATSFAHRHRAE